MRYLNLGCGDRFHPEWDNLDFVPVSTCVRAHDLRKGVPFPDGTFDVVYHSHVLEHFSREQARSFMRECRRVLKRGGTIRVAVPDLEGITRLYLEALEKARKGDAGWSKRYEWMVIEMYDQCVKQQACGALYELLTAGEGPGRDFILQRWGSYGSSLVDGIGQNATSSDTVPTKRFAWGYVLRNPLEVVRVKFMKLLLGRSQWEALQVGRFRAAGEVHMWMYDSYSLAELLKKTSFSDVQRVGAAESRIPGWAGFNLDTESDGSVYKPDSLYMEATKT